jgi:hypothetical protein
MQERSVESVIRAKNREIRIERERTQALEITNTIISAYLSLLVEKAGKVRIPKRLVSEALGNFVTSAKAEGDDYIITVERTVGEASDAGAVADGDAEECFFDGKAESEGDGGE